MPSAAQAVKNPLSLLPWNGKFNRKVGTGNKEDDQILAQRGYKLTKKLGEGSYGKVYLAIYTDPKTGKTIRLACKLIDGAKAPKEFLRKFFPRELEVMRAVNHPYLVRIHSILQRKLRYFVFMQFAEKGDMLDFIKAHGGLKEDQARIWYSQLIKGMGYMHDRNLCHRDLKCENILLTGALNIKISDFGFARFYFPKTDELSKSFCGSLAYCPPEIIRGKPYDPRWADLWSMGIILYVMLNKSLPFEDKSLKKMYDSQMSRNWKWRPKVAESLTQQCKSFMYTVMEPVADKRRKTSAQWNDPWIQNSKNPELSKGRK